MLRVAVFGGNGLLGKEVVKRLNDLSCEKVFSLDIKSSDSCCDQKDCLVLDCNNYQAVIEFISRNKINRIINCSYPRGRTYGENLGDLTNNEVLENFNVHLTSFLNTTRAGFEVFNKNKIMGRIVNLSSIYGVQPPDFSLYPKGSKMTVPLEYCIAKNALTTIANYMLKYFNSPFVVINTVAPGGIFNEQNKEFVKRYKSKNFQKRMLNCGEVADLINYLIIDAPTSIIGQEFLIDDGFTLN